MPLRWYDMLLEEQADAILEMVEGLTEEEKSSVLDEWAEGTYDKTLQGEYSALADLQRLATKCLLQRLGKWDSYIQRVTSRKDN